MAAPASTEPSTPWTDPCAALLTKFADTLIEVNVYTRDGHLVHTARTSGPPKRRTWGSWGTPSITSLPKAFPDQVRRLSKTMSGDSITLPPITEEEALYETTLRQELDRVGIYTDLAAVVVEYQRRVVEGTQGAATFAQGGILLGETEIFHYVRGDAGLYLLAKKGRADLIAAVSNTCVVLALGAGSMGKMGFAVYGLVDLVEAMKKQDL